MMPASIFAEALRNEDAPQGAREYSPTRESLATREHVDRHYPAIALPALAAATHRIVARRTARLAAASAPARHPTTDAHD